MKPLCIELYAGLGGWSQGAILEGFDCVGFDIEQHVYGEHRYPGQLVVQDVLTLHGSQFKSAALIVASPPCQTYSWMAMPWSLAKAKAAAIRADETGKALADLNRLFDACFRIQREACDAAGHHIPMIVENVRGAQPWVGRARWNYGSFYLFGDVPALMPITFRGTKVPTFRFDGSGKSFQSASVEYTGVKAPGMNWSDQTKRGQDFTRLAGDHARKNSGGSWFNVAHNTTSGKGNNPDGRNIKTSTSLVDAAMPLQELSSPDGESRRGLPEISLDGTKVPSDEGRRTDVGKGARFTTRDCRVEADHLKQPGIGGKRDNGKGGDAWFQDGAARHGSKSPGRKAASAMIAKIPLPLARHIAATFRPENNRR